MTAAVPEPGPREVFQDARGPQRFLRASWHPGEHLVAISIWSGQECRATFRLPTDEVPDLVGLLVRGLAVNGPPSGDVALPWTGALDVATLPTLAADPPPTPTSEPPSRRPAADVLRRMSVRALGHCARGAEVLRDRLDRAG